MPEVLGYVPPDEVLNLECGGGGDDPPPPRDERPVEEAPVQEAPVVEEDDQSFV